MNARERTKRLRMDIVDAQHLKNNKLGDPSERYLSVFLPKSYHRSTSKRYPVAYLLHGFSGSAWRFAGDFEMSAGPQWLSFLDGADEAIGSRRCREMILVMPDGANRLGCGQWVDSGCNGNYARYVAEDVVGYVDAHYRTIPERTHRMVQGISSGGFGAFHIGGSHPDIFGAAAICSADMYFEVTHLPFLIRLVNAAWPKGFNGPVRGNMATWISYGLAAAYSPNPRKPPYYCDLPIRFPTGELIDDVWQKWLDFDPIYAYKRYIKAFQRMHIYTDCGNRDEFNLHMGHRILHERLKKARVKHVYDEFNGGHAEQYIERTQKALEWFSDLLKKSR